jgi:flavorubredoxin
MKISIIIHSQSGHTAFFARAISECLTKAGHDTNIELLRPNGVVKPGARNVALRRIPDIAECEALIIGGPVMGFRPSPVAMAFLNSFESLKGKKALAIATFALGGSRHALGKMTAALEQLSAQALEGKALRWTFKPSASRLSEAAMQAAAPLIGK